MNKRKCLPIVTLILRLTVILGLIGMPSTGWGYTYTDQTNISNSSMTLLLSDGQFVYGPNVDDFDLKAYLHDNAHHLFPFYEELFYYSIEPSINPRVLLTFLELRTGIVTIYNGGDPYQQELLDVNSEKLRVELATIASTLTNAYYEYKWQSTQSVQSAATNPIPTIYLTDGAEWEIAAGINAATYASLKAMSSLMDTEAMIRFVDKGDPKSFYQIYSHLFPNSNPLDTMNQVGKANAPPDDLLQLPFPVSESWWFNAPHSWDGKGGQPKASMDFAKAKRNWGDNTGDDWVVSAMDGVVSITSNCGVRVHHDSGWETTYYHLENIKVSDGKRINRNTPIANYASDKSQALCAGGSSTAPHVHITLKYNGELRSLHNVSLSSWRVSAQDFVDYSKNCDLVYLQKGGTKKCPYSYISNDGMGTTSPPVPNRSPNTPSLKSPSDRSVTQDGRAPTLCWNNNGDPDGDPLQFYAEVFDSPRGANSGWTGNTCWRPEALDGDYSNYQWRVKARDSRGAESGWSETRHFTIEQPNAVPLISFNTANGNSADTINSRDQNWTFTGTASDPENKLSRVEFKCEGDSCNAQENLGANGNWSYTRNGLTGENQIRFRACDEKQCSDYSRTVTLRIDLAAPTTKAELSGQKAGDWYNSAVTVKFHSDDGATGNARVGVDKIFYRLDGGGWQSGGGQDVSFTVNQDGAHTVEYYAVDGLGNQEATKSISFKVDATPPAPPSNASELNGVVNGQWQKAVGAPPAPVPVFQWQPGSDAMAGLFQHELYFGDKADGADPQKFVLPTDAATWTPLPAGVRTGTWYLRARARDKANNVSDWVTLFTFRYDNTPPANPATATHDANIANNTWQRTSSVPNFTWTPASDEGSGLQGYRLYWGSDSNGQADNLSPATTYQTASPLCAADQACIGYLRIRSVDNVNNEAAAWGTLFTLKYDGLPPILDLKVNNGVTYTAQTLVTLNLNGVDEHSGLREMRFSHDGVVWTPWEAYATEKIWQIPAIGRQSWPVYAQVRDGVGNESAVSHQEVYFEVNRQQPQSASYRLFDSLNSAGVGSHTSTSYQGASTVGQVVDAARTGSDNYRITGGYQAGSQAIPLVIPGHDEFTFINGVFASGVVVNTMQSASYAMLATVGEVGLPNNTTTLNSASYQHQPGFLAAVPAATHVVPTPVPTPGPTPLPEPTPDCEFAIASVNDGALFTNSPAVTLKLCAPRVQQMIVSNDGGFGGAQWETYARQKPWTITTYGQQVLPRQVYVKYRDEKNVIQTASDDIIYDPTAPSGQLLVNSPISPQVVAAAANQVQAASADGTFAVAGTTYLRQVNGVALAQPLPLVAPKQSGASGDGIDLYLIAQDDNSGMARMQLSENADFSGASWQAYAGLVKYNPRGDDGVKTLYARFLDHANNVSAATEAGFVLDSQPPLGGMSVVEQIVGPHALTVTLYLQAEDNLSGVDAMRISARESFTDAVWQPMVSNLVWPIYLIEGQSSGSLFVQFRDKIGNVSQSYQTDYLVDAQPPIIYAETVSSTDLTRTLSLYAYDELSTLSDLYLTNDPLFSEGITRQTYTETVSWTFDERHVVWIKVADSVGNLSDAYPLYAAGIEDTPVLPTENKLYLPLVNR